MNCNIEDIQKRLEAGKSFHYWKQEYGLSFDDFSIIDIRSNRKLKKGDTKIGDFCIMIDGDKMSVCYDMTVDEMKEKRLQRIGKVSKKESIQ